MTLREYVVAFMGPDRTYYRKVQTYCSNVDAVAVDAMRVYRSPSILITDANTGEVLWRCPSEVKDQDIAMVPRF